RIGVQGEALQADHRLLGLVEERREDVERLRDGVVVGRRGGEGRLPAGDQVAQRRLAAVDGVEHRAAVAQQVDHRGVLHVEHLQQVGGVGGEVRQVAEYAVEV